MDETNFQKFFESEWELAVVLLPDSPRFTIVAMSDACARRLGARREDLIGRAFFEVFPGFASASENQVLVHSLQQVLMSKGPHAVSLGASGGFGARCVVCTPVLDKDGQVEFIIQRTLESMRAEDPMAPGLEKQFRGLLDTLYDPILIVNTEGVIEFANRSTKNWFGYETRELVGQPVEILIPDRVREKHLHQRKEYMKNPISRPMGRNLQLHGVRKDGGEFPVDVSLSPFSTERGALITAFIRDVTEQKRAEQQQKFLSESSRVLTETVDYLERIQKIADFVVPQMADLCMVHLIEGNRLVPKAISHQDPTTVELLWRLARTPAVVSPHAFFGPGSVFKTKKSQLIELLDEKILSHVTRDPGDRWGLFSLGLHSYIGVPMLARGKFVGVLSFIRCRNKRFTREDLAFAELVTTRTAVAVDNALLYKDAQDAVRLREDVLAIVSHDLRNPLSLVKGFNEVIADSLRSLGAAKRDLEATEVVARSVRQMERLISDLLDFAKIESGTFAIDCKKSRVERLVWDGVETVQHHLEKKMIQISIDIRPEAIEVFCDPDRIRQVFSNLLGNAIKFSCASARILIRAERKGQEVIFSVSDDGPGVAPENLKHLFDRYWQAKETAKQGFGLGLAIAKGIVESHRGRIWVESRPGHGTTVFFSLPVVAECEESNSLKCWATS